MKKRVAAAVLGIMLSVSMGLEVPAAALDSGFESGFTSEQAADVQTEDGAEAVQPSEDTEAPADTAAAGEQNVPALVRKIGKTTYKGARTFQHHQHRNHERQNQTDAEKRGAADASFL